MSRPLGPGHGQWLQQFSRDQVDDNDSADPGEHDQRRRLEADQPPTDVNGNTGPAKMELASPLIVPPLR